MPQVQPARRRNSVADRKLRAEEVLIDRLIVRQGLTHTEARDLVEQYRRNGRAEIDPALMEGLDEL